MSSETFGYVLSAICLVLLLISVFIFLIYPQNIREYIQKIGGKVLKMRWDPFGAHWPILRGAIYHVYYLDKDGNEHEVYVQPNIWDSAFMTEDRIAKQSENHPSSVEALEQENRQLKAELENLKRKEKQQ